MRIAGHIGTQHVPLLRLGEFQPRQRRQPVSGSNCNKQNFQLGDVCFTLKLLVDRTSVRPLLAHPCLGERSQIVGECCKWYESLSLHNFVVHRPPMFTDTHLLSVAHLSDDKAFNYIPIVRLIPQIVTTLKHDTLHQIISTQCFAKTNFCDKDRLFFFSLLGINFCHFQN